MTTEAFSRQKFLKDASTNQHEISPNIIISTIFNTVWLSISDSECPITFDEVDQDLSINLGEWYKPETMKLLMDKLSDKFSREICDNKSYSDLLLILKKYDQQAKKLNNEYNQLKRDYNVDKFDENASFLRSVWNTKRRENYMENYLIPLLTLCLRCGEPLERMTKNDLVYQSSFLSYFERVLVNIKKNQMEDYKSQQKKSSTATSGALQGKPFQLVNKTNTKKSKLPQEISALWTLQSAKKLDDRFYNCIRAEFNIPTHISSNLEPKWPATRVVEDDDQPVKLEEREESNVIISKDSNKQVNRIPAIYLCGNSLGAQAKQSVIEIEHVLKKWSKQGVEGWFFDDNAKVSPHDNDGVETIHYNNSTEEDQILHHLSKPTHDKENQLNTSFLHCNENVLQYLVPLLGAKVKEEIGIMNALTVNLHLMLTYFWHPNKSSNTFSPMKSKRFHIIMEKDAFPSDVQAVASHVNSRGFDPKEVIIFVEGMHSNSTFQTKKNLVPKSHAVEHDPAIINQEITGNGGGRWMENGEDFISVIRQYENTLSLVVISGVHYTTGEVLAIPQICHATHEAGAYCGVDLAHAVGNIPLKLHDWGVDFAVFCTYKYLCSGPGGVGGIFFHQTHHLQSSLPPIDHESNQRLSGWWGLEVSRRFNFDDGFDNNYSAQNQHNNALYSSTLKKDKKNQAVRERKENSSTNSQKNVVDYYSCGASGFQLSTPSPVLNAALLGSLKVMDKAGGIHLLRRRSVFLNAYLDILLYFFFHEKQDTLSDTFQKFMTRQENSSSLLNTPFTGPSTVIDENRSQSIENQSRQSKVQTYSIHILTPTKFEKRGCQTSLLINPYTVYRNQKRKSDLVEQNEDEHTISSELLVDVVLINKLLLKNGIICDVRRPNILRVSPKPLYNSFEDIFRFAHTLKMILNHPELYI